MCSYTESTDIKRQKGEPAKIQTSRFPRAACTWLDLAYPEQLASHTGDINLQTLVDCNLLTIMQTLKNLDMKVKDTFRGWQRTRAATENLGEEHQNFKNLDTKVKDTFRGWQPTRAATGNLGEKHQNSGTWKRTTSNSGTWKRTTDISLQLARTVKIKIPADEWFRYANKNFKPDPTPCPGEEDIPTILNETARSPIPIFHHASLRSTQGEPIPWEIVMILRQLIYEEVWTGIKDETRWHPIIQGEVDTSDATRIRPKSNSRIREGSIVYIALDQTTATQRQHRRSSSSSTPAPATS